MLSSRTISTARDPCIRRRSNGKILSIYLAVECAVLSAVNSLSVRCEQRSLEVHSPFVSAASDGGSYHACGLRSSSKLPAWAIDLNRPGDSVNAPTALG